MSIVTLPQHLLTTSGRLRTSNRYALGGFRHTSDLRKTLYQIRIWGAVIEYTPISGPGFLVGETVTGVTSGKIGVITEVGAGFIVYRTQDNDFIDSEQISNNEASPTVATVNTHNTGSHVWHDYYNACIMLKCGTRTNDRVVVQTSRYFPYIEGLDHADAATVVFDSQDNANQYAIYGDDENGTGAMMEGTKKAILLRTNTSGTPVDYVSYGNRIGNFFRRWINGFAVNFGMGNIFENEFRWLGYGDRVLQVTISGLRIIADRMSFAGKQQSPSMRTPTLPIRAEIVNTGITIRPTVMRFVCAGVYSEGGIASTGFSMSYGIGLHEPKIIVSGGLRILGAVRMKSQIKGHKNRMTAELKNFVATIAGDNATAYLYHAHGVRSITGGTWITHGSYDPVEYNFGLTSLIADEIHLLQIIPLYPGGPSGKGGSEKISTLDLDNHKYISSNFESENVPGNYSEMFYVAIYMEANVDGESTGSFTLSLYE